MFASVELLIVGDSRETITPIVESLEGQQMLSPLPYVVPRGEVMLPQYMDPAPDAIVFYVDEDWRDPVWELIEQMPRPRPPLFVMTPDNDMELLRTAMRLGVRDVFTMPVDVDDFVSAVTHIVREDRIRRGEEASRLISLMNTKGGSGASLIAANVALAMANQATDKRRLLLVDFDFQFGGLPTYLNLVARDGLIKAMEFVESLDLSSLQAYVQRHDSGLDLLAAAMEEIIVPEDVTAERTGKLLEAVNGAYDDILVDLPHRIDASIAVILQRSDVIALVAQQTVAHLHDTKRLIFLLRERLGIAGERVLLVINRYDRKAEVSLDDFRDVFPDIQLWTLPGDYVLASESINLGVPICDSAPRSQLGRSLIELARYLEDPQQKPEAGGKPGLMSRLKQAFAG